MYIGTACILNAIRIAMQPYRLTYCTLAFKTWMLGPVVQLKESFDDLSIVRSSTECFIAVETNALFIRHYFGLL